MGWLSSARFSRHRLRHLPRSQRAVIVRTGLLLPLVATLLRVAGYRRAQRWLARAAPLRDLAPTGDSGAVASATALTVTAVGSRLGYRCLSRSLTLWALLRRQGIDARLHIGVRKEGPALEAHAWVEHDGIALGDVGVHERFAGFHSVPGAASAGSSSGVG